MAYSFRIQVSEARELGHRYDADFSAHRATYRYPAGDAGIMEHMGRVFIEASGPVTDYPVVVVTTVDGTPRLVL